MVFEHIEKLKQEYTDKYVTVDGSRPELRRFGGMTGTVRTVNMSGRALVEFDAYNNIGWYDIDVDFLKVIDEPLAKPEAKPEKAAAKASPKAAPAAKKDAAKKDAPAAKPAAAAAGSMSIEEMMAAARANKAGGAAAAPAKADPKAMSAADVMAAARTQKGGESAAAAPPPAKDASAMSVAEMLAAARGEVSGSGSASPPAATPAPATPAPAAPAPAAAPAAKKDPGSMSVAEMLAAARGEVAGGGAAAAVPAAAASGGDPAANVRSLLEAGRKPKAGAAAAADKPDDLKLIKGIGPKIESLLHEAGITTFAKLAGESVPRLTEILDASGSDRLKQIANEETWPEQAAAFASGIAPAQDQPAAPPAAEETPAADESDSGEVVPRSDITSVDEQLAYCRRVDGGG